MPLAAVDRPRRVRWVGPPVAAAVERVRRDLPRVLMRWQVREELIDEVVVVVGGLLDTLVQHPGCGFCVLVELDRRRLHVTVEDHAAAAAPLWAPPTKVGSRRGLRLVDATALWGSWHEQDAGKTVWAEFLA